MMSHNRRLLLARPRVVVMVFLKVASVTVAASVVITVKVSRIVIVTTSFNSPTTESAAMV